MVAFPNVQLPLTVAIAPGADPAAPTTYLWQEITSDVRTDGGVVIQAGRQDEAQDVNASSCALTIDNRSGNYSTRNPLGTWYGQLAKGTPLQARVTLINDQFTRTVASGLGTDADSGTVWSGGAGNMAVNGAQATISLPTDNTSTLATAGTVGSPGFDAQYTSSVTQVPVGAAWVHAVVFWYGSSSDYYRAHTEFDPSGTVKVKVQHRTGTTTDILGITDSGVTFAANTKIRTRVQVFGNIARIKVWLASGSEPSAWTLQGSVGTAQPAGYGTGLYALRVGGMTTGPSGLVEDFRFDTIRVTASVPEWPIRWDQTGSNVTAPITGAGILRRLSQGQSALHSPMYRQITQYTSLLGHWPLEDPSGATVLTNTVPNGQAGTYVSSTLGSSDKPPGASASAQTSTLSIMAGVFKPDVNSGWQFCFSIRLAATPGGTQTEMIHWTTNNGYTWSWQTDNAGFRLLVTAGSTTWLDSTVTWGSGIDPTKWIHYRCKVSVSGGTVTAERAWFNVGATVIYGTTDTFSGTAGHLNIWRQSANSTIVNGYICHVFGVSGTADDLNSYDALRSFDGYVGELAGDRIVRLAGEEGVPIMVTGTTSTTAAMGQQTSATLLDQLRECEAGDQGVLHERGAGLGYLTRTARYNQTAGMALDFNTGHIGAPPEPTDDDQRLRNKINLTRTGGTTVTQQNSTSIALSGVYSDDITVNLANDGDLQYHAGWRVHLGTIDDLRWPRIELNLAGNPSLINAWCQMRIGSRLTIANPPAAVAGQPLDLIVEGWQETLQPYRWDVVLICSPASAYSVGVYDATSARYDSIGTTLNAGVTAGATTLVLTYATASDRWSVLAGSQPYDLLISGEQVRVPVGGMGAQTGTGPYTQTITGATRAINGISKALPAGAAVHIANPGRYAL